MGSVAVNCCLAGSARGQYRVTPSATAVYHPTECWSCKLLFSGELTKTRRGDPMWSPVVPTSTKPLWVNNLFGGRPHRASPTATLGKSP